MPTILSFLSGRQITNDSGVPQTGAELFHYRELTTTNLTVWQDEAGTIPHPQPVPCDSGGFVPLIYVDDTFDWKVVIKTAAGVTLKTYDELAKAESAVVSATYSFAKFPWTQVSSASSPVILTAADAGKSYEADTTGGNVEFDLPAAGSVPNGTGFIFKKTAAANQMILDPNGAETIDDVSTSMVITRQYQVVEILSNVAEWYVASAYLDDASVAVEGGVNALTISNNAGAPTTQLDIVCSEAVLINSVGIGLRVGAQALTLNAATIGVNGIDAGGLANNTWYYIYLISNGATTGCLLSTSATAPTMPSGYTFKYRIGAQRTAGAATFNRVLQKGNIARFVVVAASVTPNLISMISGASGAPTTPTWTAVATGNFVPTTATRIAGLLNTTASGGRVMAAPNNAYGVFNSATNPPPVATITGSAALNQAFEFTLESTNIFYASDFAQAALFAMGWTDAVNAN
jgi:hypothetical protein